MRRPLLTLALLCLLALPAWAEDLVVVVRAGSDIPQLSRNDVVNIFLGRFRELPNGQSLAPYDLPPNSWERSVFYERLLNKTRAEISAYWARLIFSGRVAPPKVADNADRMLEILAADTYAIGYLDRDKVDRRVRIVYEVRSP